MSYTTNTQGSIGIVLADTTPRYTLTYTLNSQETVFNINIQSTTDTEANVETLLGEVATYISGLTGSSGTTNVTKTDYVVTGTNY
jgi:hypothetical protein